jgi:hypothetical protein
MSVFEKWEGKRVVNNFIKMPGKKYFSHKYRVLLLLCHPQQANCSYDTMI